MSVDQIDEINRTLDTARDALREVEKGDERFRVALGGGILLALLGAGIGSLAIIDAARPLRSLVLFLPAVFGGAALGFVTGLLSFAMLAVWKVK